MKKISCLALLTALVLPAFAEEAVAPVETDTVVSEQNESVVSEEIAKQFEQPALQTTESSNPKIRFPHGLQLGLGVSPTSGLNAFVGYNNKNFDSFWAKRFGVRLDFATYSPIKNRLNTKINDAVGTDGVKIGDSLKVDDFALNARHIGALVDFYPFGNTWFLGGWRISGGYMTGKLDFDAGVYGTRKIDKVEFELDGKKYTYEGDKVQGKASLDWKYSGPYLGTGFDLGLFYGFKIYFDAGVVFADKSAKINLDIPTNGLRDANGTEILQPDESTPQEIKDAYNTFMAAKDNTLKEAQDELDKYPYYPIVKLGFMYRF
jgi:hypothetical protein